VVDLHIDDLIIRVEDVCDVLNAHNERVLAIGEEFQLHFIGEASWLEQFGHAVAWDALQAKAGWLVGVEGEELLNWGVDNLLDLSLEWGASESIEELNVVGGWYGDSIAEWSLLIQSFSNTTTVIILTTVAAVLHELDSTIDEHGATLRAIIHDGHLGVGGFVNNGDGIIDGVVVGSDIKTTFEDGQVPCWSVVQDALLHFEAVWIGVEHLIVIQVGVEIHSHFLARMVSIWNTK
jgi:hypothetical protein